MLKRKSFSLPYFWVTIRLEGYRKRAAPKARSEGMKEDKLLLSEYAGTPAPFLDVSLPF